MSPTGNDVTATAGFTLLELLVVMGIMALCLALLPVAVLSRTEAQSLKADLRQTAAALRYARSRAIFQNTPVSMTIDTLDMAIDIDGQADERRLHATTSISLSLAPIWRSDHAGAFVFNPDGSSSGGALRLSNDSGNYDIVVDWLTGTVTATKG